MNNEKKLIRNLNPNLIKGMNQIHDFSFNDNSEKDNTTIEKE